MSMIGIFEVKNKLSEICERVATTHKSVVITRRGKPLVRLVPYLVPSEKSIWDTVKEGRERYGLLEDVLILPKRSEKSDPIDPLD